MAKITVGNVEKGVVVCLLGCVSVGSDPPCSTKAEPLKARTEGIYLSDLSTKFPRPYNDGKRLVFTSTWRFCYLYARASETEACRINQFDGHQSARRVILVKVISSWQQAWQPGKSPNRFSPLEGSNGKVIFYFLG